MSQHESGVMQVAHHFFENGMAFFTRMLQIGISMTVAGGDGEYDQDFADDSRPFRRPQRLSPMVRSARGLFCRFV